MTIYQRAMIQIQIELPLMQPRPGKDHLKATLSDSLGTEAALMKRCLKAEQ